MPRRTAEQPDRTYLESATNSRQLGNRALTRSTSLELSDDLSLEDWEALGGRLFIVSNASMWWLGDWLVYGQRNYPGRYRMALGRTGLNYQTLRNYAWVARNVSVERRRAALSFQHHAEVAPLPPDERDEWLERAEKQRWSRAQLRAAVRASRRGALEGGRGVQIQLDVDEGQLARFREAADERHQDLTAWMIDVLERATDAHGR